MGVISHLIYISQTDLWGAGKTTYRVKKSFEDTQLAYDDGVHILYVNAAVDDGSETAKLMEYFKTTDPEDMSQGDLSKRVHFLKLEKGGQDEMCEVSEKWYREGKMEQAREAALNLAGRGMSVADIADVIKVSLETVQKWLSGNVNVAK